MPRSGDTRESWTDWRTPLIGIALLALGSCAHDSAPQTPASDAREGLPYRIVASLTTEVGPRLAGTPAEAAARDWGVNKLTELGFKNVHVEPFTIAGWVRGHEHAAIVAPTKQNLAVAALGNSIATRRGGITAPVAFVASYDELLKAPAGAFTGKIVFVNDSMTRARDGAGYSPAVRKRSKGASEAARRGALAYVIRSVGTDSDRFAHAGHMTYAKDAKKIPAAAISIPDADQIERLHQQGRTVTLNLELHPRTIVDAPSGNVVGDIPGTEKPDEIVLLAAHLDSWDLGTGAIDDGAGVAIVTAAALRAAGPEMKPKRTIRVVLYGAEEVGVHGGDAYAKRHVGTVAKHVLAMEADFGTGPAWRYSTNVPEADLPFYDALGRELADLGLERGDNKAGGGADIAALRKLGVPVVGIGQDGTTYFDLHHTANDTLDKIDAEALDQVTESFARVAKAVANR